MDDYINRQDAIKVTNHAWYKGLSPAQYIEMLDAADVAPVVHARWQQDEDTGSEMVRCSVCREVYDSKVTPEEFAMFYHYCPHCGAKMDIDGEPGYRARDFAETHASEITRGIQDGLRAGETDTEKLKQELGIKSPHEVFHQWFYGKGQRNE